MESARGNSSNGGKTLYELERDENVEENKEMMASLGLVHMAQEMTCNEPRKRAKVISCINCSTTVTLLI